MIYSNIVALCKERGISIARLERETGLGNATIRGWISGSPTVDRLKLVADYFGISIDQLISVDFAGLEHQVACGKPGPKQAASEGRAGGVEPHE